MSTRSSDPADVERDATLDGSTPDGTASHPEHTAVLDDFGSLPSNGDSPASEPVTSRNVVDSSGAPFPVQDTNVEPERPKRKSRRKLWVSLAVVGVLLAGAAAAGWWFVIRETDEDRYLAALSSGGFKGQYATPDVALATGHAFCTALTGGGKTEGFDYQQVAVAQLCPQFKASFKVIPTPEQQAATYTKLLRDKSLGGKFPSDAAAVSHAEAVCRGLDEGAVQQGPEVDAVGVSVYCTKYLSGFTTLYPIKVAASFILYDNDPNGYFPSISGSNSSCSGTGGYNDISPGTEVLIKNNAGDVLTTTNLGAGTGSVPYSCKFKFSFTVMDGEKGGYMVEVGHRGGVHFTAANLKVPDDVTVTLGN